MDSDKLKELVFEAIRYHFYGALQMVQQVGGGAGKAPSAIENIKKV